MTLSTTANKVSYAGDGTTVSFAIPFLFLENAHISAVLHDAAGTETTWALNTEFTLTGAGAAAGGTLTVVVSPSDYTPAAGETLVIRRVVPETQETDYPEGGAFPASAHEQALDKLTMLVQQHAEEIARALKVPVTDLGIATTLATVADRANKILSFDNNGDFALVAAADESANTATASVGTESISHASRFAQRLTVKDFGATGDGATDDRADIAAALVGAAGGDLYFPAGIYRISGALTLTAGVNCIFANGAALKPDNGVEVTVAGEVQAGNWRIFDVSAAGTFDTGALARSNIKWFGAAGDGSTDDTAAVQAAIDSAGGANTHVFHVPGGTYILTDTLNMDAFTFATGSYDGIYFVGEGRYASRFQQTADNRSVIDWKAQVPTTNIYRFNKCGIHDMTLWNSFDSDNGYVLDMEGIDQFSLHNCQISSRASGNARTLMRVYEFTNSWINFNEFNGGGDQIVGRAGVTVANYFNMIQNNQFLDFTGSAIDFDDCDQTMIQNNWMGGPVMGVGVAADDPVVQLRGDNRKVVVSGNNIQFSRCAIQVEGTGARVLKNSCTQHDDANTFQTAIRFTNTNGNPALAEGAQKSFCVGNTIDGENLNAAIFSSVGDIDIMDNVSSSIDGNAYVGITLNSTETKNVRVIGNKLDNGQISFSSGTAADSSILFRPQDNWLRTGSRRRSYVAAPTNQYFQIGDRVENSVVAASGPPGWVCTVAGSPGTWNAEATVAA